MNLTAFGETKSLWSWLQDPRCTIGERDIKHLLALGATHEQAISFKSTRPEGHSRFKGVTWDAAKRMWQSQIKVNGKVEWLGRYDSDVEAARVFDARATQLKREPNFK